MTGTTCPQEIHVANKRSNLRLVWRSPEWKKESAAYKARTFPVCSRCFRVGPIVPGHSGTDYTHHEMKSYIDKVREDRVVPLCHQCNKYEAKGRHPCPECIAAHREDPNHYIRYIVQGDELCWGHEHGADGIIPGRKVRYTNMHSCDWHGKGQSCANPLRRDKICPYSSRKARDQCNADHFMARKTKGAKA